MINRWRIGLAAALALAGCGSTAQTALDAGAGTDTAPLRPGDTTMMLDHGGVARTYILHVPPGYDGATAVPLVLDIHGLTSSAAVQEAISGWRQKADAEGFIVAYPNGLDASWNAGALCCGQSQMTGVDDEGFLRALVAKTRQDARIDSKRIYISGLSNGGAMSHYMACRAADIFAAAAPVSMGNGTTPCQPARPLSVIMFRGTSDPLVPYTGGMFPSAQADFDQWTGIDQCSGALSMTHGICATKSHCGGDSEVTLCTINAGHVLYLQASTQGAPVADVAWEAFTRHTLP